MRKVTEKCIMSQWLSDGIGEDYKYWKPRSAIFIEAPTGSGKTSFIIDRLFPYAAQRGLNILLLSNRVALDQQIKETIQTTLYGAGTEEPNLESSQLSVYKYSQTSGMLVVSKYQNVLSNYSIFCTPNFFSYVIMDEAHYFLADSLFNPYTEIVNASVLKENREAVRIYLSATITESIEKLWQLDELAYQSIYRNKVDGLPPGARDALLKIEVVHYVKQPDYSLYDIIFFQKYEEILKEIILTTDPNKKWLIFVSSKNEGKNLKKVLKEKGISSAFLSADEKNNKEWKRIINEKCFRGKTLITTKVLDNGVTLSDCQLKNIVLPVCERIDFIQMLGRKRVQPGERVRVFANIPSKRKLESYLHHVEKKMHIIEWVESCEKRKSPEALKKLWQQCNPAINHLFYIDDNGHLQVNSFAKMRLGQQRDFYQELLRNAGNPQDYPQMVLCWLGLSTEIKWLNMGMTHKTMDDFIQHYLGIEIADNQREAVYNEFIACYDSIPGPRLGNMRKYSKAAINKGLKLLNYQYKFVVKNKLWILEPIEVSQDNQNG